jgi:hypothetical protein
MHSWGQEAIGECEQTVHIHRLVVDRYPEGVGRGLDRLRDRDVAGHDRDRDPAPFGIGAKLEQESETAHPRHRQIEQDGVRSKSLVHQAERVFRGGRPHRRVSAKLQGLGEKRSNAFFVLDDQDRLRPDRRFHAGCIGWVLMGH